MQDALSSAVTEIEFDLLIGWLTFNTVKILSVGTDRSEHTVQIQIRLLHQEQSEQDLHYL